VNAVAKFSVLIVDDSPFSQSTISALLKEAGFSVCFCASTGHEAVVKYRELRPDIITMDYTLPDTDGLTCSRQILTIDPAANIILLSAMKDKKLIMKGTALGIRTFLQKPVGLNELSETLKNIVNEDKVRDEWRNQYMQYFADALTNNIKAMAHVEAQVRWERQEVYKFTAHGVAVIMGITGTCHGRFILDLSPSTLLNVVEAMLGKQDISEDETLNSIAEFANIVAGYGVSQINNRHKNMELRLTPPSLLLGDELSVINQRLASCTLLAKTAAGDIYVNVGFAGGQS
jgi:DNA-binding NarL/FixJ family response regulator